MSDVLVNNASATTTSTSGTTSPAAGTSEAWSVSALGATAPVLAVGQSARLVDLANNAEIIQVTACTGPGATSITVTRGVEGTTPVAHGTGATYQFVATVGALGSAFVKLTSTQILMSAYDTNPASTDHTTAIQNAINAAATMVDNGASLVQIVMDTRQKYTVGGSVTAGGNGQLAQIVLPYRKSLYNNPTAMGAIQLVGMPNGGKYDYIAAGQSGTVIESSLGAAPTFVRSTGIASIIGGPSSFSSARSFAGGSFSGLRFATKDLTIRSASPVIAGIDCGWVDGFSFEGLLQFDTDAAAVNLANGYPNPSALPVCTAPQAIPLITPFAFCFYGTTGDTLACTGWLGGPYCGEFGSIQRVFVYNTAGACLYGDASNQQFHIGYLIDWDNAYGIASTDPGVGATPISIPYILGAGVAPGSQYTGSPLLLGTPFTIDAWEVQRPTSGATARVYDVLDTNALNYIDCPAWSSTTNAGGYDSAPVIYVAGSTTGASAGTHRIKSKWSGAVQNSPAIPSSGTTIRNPYGRDCFVSIVGGTVSAVTVNSATTGYTTVVMVPANGSIQLTYTVAPTSWAWQAI